jgi:hypothetical protein
MLIQEFLSKLMEAELTIHVAHLQTTSYAQHNALNFYKDILEFRDGFTEMYQGDFGIVSGYTGISIKQGVEPATYLRELVGVCDKFIKTLPDNKGYIKNKIEEFQGQIYQTVYFLENLN